MYSSLILQLRLSYSSSRTSANKKTKASVDFHDPENEDVQQSTWSSRLYTETRSSSVPDRFVWTGTTLGFRNHTFKNLYFKYYTLYTVQQQFVSKNTCINYSVCLLLCFFILEWVHYYYRTVEFTSNRINKHGLEAQDNCRALPVNPLTKMR